MKTSTIRIIITLATVAAGIAAAFIGLTAGAAGYSTESYSMLMTRNPMAHIAGLPVWLAGSGWAAVFGHSVTSMRALVSVCVAAAAAIGAIYYRRNTGNTPAAAMIFLLSVLCARAGEVFEYNYFTVGFPAYALATVALISAARRRTPVRWLAAALCTGLAAWCVSARFIGSPAAAYGANIVETLTYYPIVNMELVLYWSPMVAALLAALAMTRRRLRRPRTAALWFIVIVTAYTAIISHALMSDYFLERGLIGAAQPLVLALLLLLPAGVAADGSRCSIAVFFAIGPVAAVIRPCLTPALSRFVKRSLALAAIVAATILITLTAYRHKHFVYPLDEFPLHAGRTTHAWEYNTVKAQADSLAAYRARGINTLVPYGHCRLRMMYGPQLTDSRDSFTDEMITPVQPPLLRTYGHYTARVLPALDRADAVIYEGYDRQEDWLIPRMMEERGFDLAAGLRYSAIYRRAEQSGAHTH